MPERFAYYQRLDAKDRRIYRQSDAITQLPIQNADALYAWVQILEQVLASGDLPGIRYCVQSMTDEFLFQLSLKSIVVHVHLRRPSGSAYELHGYYENEQITVYCRTAIRDEPVALRTFCRTLLHEICHHLDYAFLNLEDSFHTLGFFAREHHLFEQIFTEQP